MSCLSKSGMCLKSVSANVADHPACPDGCELYRHVHDENRNCLACYYGEPPQFTHDPQLRWSPGPAWSP